MIKVEDRTEMDAEMATEYQAANLEMMKTLRVLTEQAHAWAIDGDFAMLNKCIDAIDRLHRLGV
jgi:muconolactone delta-isomerase